MWHEVMFRLGVHYFCPIVTKTTIAQELPMNLSYRSFSKKKKTDGSATGAGWET